MEEPKMKKITALLLALMMLIGMVGIVVAETTATETTEPELPVYKLQNVKKSGNLISGEIELVSGEKVEGENLYVTITMFLPDNKYIKLPAPVYSDNTFELSTNLTIEHLTFVLRGRNADSQVNVYTSIGFDVQ